MATWAFYGWTSGTDTAANASSAIALNGDSALSFGGGNRDDFQTNISLDSWNTAMHYAKDTSESAVDYCTNSHLWPLTPQVKDFTSRSTACLLDGTYINMTSGSPDPAHGIGLRFTHTFGVKCNPVTIWAGTAQTAQTNPQSCYVAICDLTSSQPTWSTVRPGNKLNLKVHGSEAEEHWWNVGIGVVPLVVGHNGENLIKVECTYY